MSRTARFFKSKKGLAVGDISKFFQQVFISKSSYPLQLLVWRKNGDPKEPLTYWTIPRLTYGHKSASTLAKMSLEMITEYGESKCELCSGNFSITNPERSTVKSCFTSAQVAATAHSLPRARSDFRRSYRLSVSVTAKTCCSCFSRVSLMMHTPLSVKH